MGIKIPSITLNKHADRRLAIQHPWVYSNELHETVDLKGFEPGSLVQVRDRHGNYVGQGFINPHSLIAVRILTRNPEAVLDGNFFRARFCEAIRRREPFYGAKSSARGTYRAVFGESDGLPGLIVDRYGSVWVMEFHALGMAAQVEVLSEALGAAVTEALGAEQFQTLVLRSDVRVAKQEGLVERQEVSHGELPKELFAWEGNLAIPVDVLGGQKTGFFFDQRENRATFTRIVAARKAAGQGTRTIDAYCHLGAWGLQALQAGAEHVAFADQSEEVLAQVKAIVEKNSWSARASFHSGDALGFLREQEKRNWDCIALDPPAFVTSKKTLNQGLRAYFNNNREAARLLKDEGVLSTSSCSFHCEEQNFNDLVASACLDAGHVPRILERGGPALDHPTLANVAETRYLKNLVLQLGAI